MTDGEIETGANLETGLYQGSLTVLLDARNESPGAVHLDMSASKFEATVNTHDLAIGWRISRHNALRTGSRGWQLKPVEPNARDTIGRTVCIRTHEWVYNAGRSTNTLENVIQRESNRDRFGR